MSESLYEKNLKVLMKKQAYLGHALQERDPSEPMKRYDLRDVNGVPVLLYRRSSGEEILFTSMLDPVAAARSYAEEIDYSRNRFTVIQIGLGLGLVAEEILTRLNQKALLFICEPHLELIQAVLALRDFSEYIENGNLLFICGDLQKVSPAEQIRRFSYIAFPNMTSKNQPVTFPVYDIEYIGFANAMLRRFQDEKNYVKFGIGNNVDDTLVGWDNYLVNNEYVMRHMGIREFKRLAGDRYKKRPAFIVASGPSLNKNVHLLKDVDDSALILSCDGSMDLLKRMGITVDAVGSVERIKYTHDCFYRGRDFPDETLVVAPSVVYPGIYEKFDKGIAFPKGGIPTAEWVNQFSDDKKGAMACGPSVAHMLFNFAWEAGCEPIVLLGQDLAYSPEGYSHNTDADGVLERLEIKEKYEYWVDDYEGNKIPSTYIWQKFLKAFENIFAKIDRTVIDASEGGARIAGTEIMSLQEVIDRYVAGTGPIDKLHRLYDEWTFDAKLYEESQMRAVEMIAEKTDHFIDFLGRVEDALDMIDESRIIVMDRIETQEQLDFIYDTIEFAGDDLIKEIREDGIFSILFRYYIQMALYALSQVEGDSFTEENIKENVLILEGLHKKICLYTEKSLKILLKQYEAYYERAVAEYPEKIPAKKDYGKYIERFAGAEYDLPFSVFYGNGGKEHPDVLQEN